MEFERGKDPIRALELGMYIYDNGFGPRWYVCGNCRSIRLERKVKGRFQPSDYYCHDCGGFCTAPIWIDINPETGKTFESNGIKFKDPKNGFIRT